MRDITKRVFVALVALIVGACSFVGGVDARGGGARSGAVYVALGDSYAAGEGLGGFEAGTDHPANASQNSDPKKNTCHRSSSDGYGSLSAKKMIVLPSLPARSRSFWACSGATSQNMMTAVGTLPVRDNRYQYGQPDQTRTVTARTRYISVSAGGNDVGFGDLGKACAAVVWAERVSHPAAGTHPCAERIKTAKGKLPALAAHLTNLYRTLLDRAPHALLSAVGYPKVFPADFSKAYFAARSKQSVCVTNMVNLPDQQTVRVGVAVDDAKNLDKSIIRGLNSTARTVVANLAKTPAYAGRITYADSYNPAVPHNCTGRTRGVSVAGLVLGGRWYKTLPTHWNASSFVSGATFHPTKAGQQVLGAAVQRAFTDDALEPVISTTQLPYAHPGQAYETSLTTKDHRSGNWAITSGALPPGLELDGYRITGEPTQEGNYPITLKFTDLRGQTVSAAISVRSVPPLTATITRTSGEFGYATKITNIVCPKPDDGYTMFVRTSSMSGSEVAYYNPGVMDVNTYYPDGPTSVSPGSGDTVTLACAQAKSGPDSIYGGLGAAAMTELTFTRSVDGSVRRVTLSTDTAAAGDKVDVSDGGGCPTYPGHTQTAAIVLLDGNFPGRYDSWRASVATDADGRWPTTTMTVPSWAATGGRYEVIAECYADDGSMSLQAPATLVVK